MYKVLFLCCMVINLKAQSLDGLWQGNYTGFSFGTSKPTIIKFDFTISNDSIINGSTHLLYKRSKFEHYAIEGKISKNDSFLTFTETRTLGLDIGTFFQNCKGVYRMKLVRKDSIIRYEGEWRDVKRNLFSCPKSGVYFERKNMDYKILKKESVDSVLNLIEVSNKKKDSILIEFYDDAVVDGDMISVELNDTPIVQNIRLSDKVTTTSFILDATKPINKLRIIAISEGTIPPCTGIIYITVNNQKYSFNLRSTYNTNNAIQFFLK